MAATNLIGHVVLVDELIKRDKLKNVAMYAGSEAARPSGALMTRLLPEAARPYALHVRTGRRPTSNLQYLCVTLRKAQAAVHRQNVPDQ